MEYQFKDFKTSAEFKLLQGEDKIDVIPFDASKNKLLTIAWNRVADQNIEIDGKIFTFPKDSVLPLTSNAIFKFENPKDIIAWQFNRDFYCIIDHDKEVSCAGFIFYGSNQQLFIKLDNTYQQKLNLLLQICIDEFEEQDNIQGEMLRMLLKRLIILITRLGKLQYSNTEEGSPKELDIVRQFNLEVESHFKKLHQVQDYAALLNKSPKTLSNIFSKLDQKTPLQIIKERITIEAKRLMLYTDRSFKEIAFELGFDDPTGFSRFFKSQEGQSPTSFRKSTN